MWSLIAAEVPETSTLTNGVIFTAACTVVIGALRYFDKRERDQRLRYSKRATKQDEKIAELEKKLTGALVELAVVKADNQVLRSRCESRERDHATTIVAMTDLRRQFTLLREAQR